MTGPRKSTEPARSAGGSQGRGLPARLLRLSRTWLFEQLCSSATGANVCARREIAREGPLSCVLKSCTRVQLCVRASESTKLFSTLQQTIRSLPSLDHRNTKFNTLSASTDYCLFVVK